MTTAETSRLAGVIDGCGFLSIDRLPAATDRVRYRLRIGMVGPKVQVDQPLLQKQFGGKIIPKLPDAIWEVTSQEALATFAALEQFLNASAQTHCQAIVIRAFLQRHPEGSYETDEPPDDEGDCHWQEVKRLNEQQSRRTALP